MTLSTAVGLASICIWVVAQVPQVVKNQQRRHTDDLSVYFLALWLAGDGLNLAGCCLIGGTGPQVALGAYFVLSDLVLLLQWWAFSEHAAAPTAKPPRSNWCYLWVAALGIGSLVTLHSLLQGIPASALGDLCGWGSGLIYLASRVPQLYHTCTSHRVEDLSVWLFVCAVLGNTTYAASILLHSRHASWLRKQAPFLLGSLSTMAFDAVLIYQCLAYRGAAPGESPLSPARRLTTPTHPHPPPKKSTSPTLMAEP